MSNNGIQHQIYLEFIRGFPIAEICEKYEVDEKQLHEAVNNERSSIPVVSTKDLIKDTIFKSQREINFLFELRAKFLKGVDDTNIETTYDANQKTVRSKKVGIHKKIHVSGITGLTREIREYERFIASLRNLLTSAEEGIYDKFMALMNNAKTPEQWRESRLGKSNPN